MTKREALLRAVLDDPTDLTVRFVLADYLEENSYEVLDLELALRIRGQPDRMGIGCLQFLKDFWGLAPVVPVRASVHEVSLQDTVLRQNHRRSFSTLYVRHGFVEGIAMRQSRFLKVAKWLFEQWPIRQVVLHGFRPLQISQGPFHTWHWLRGGSFGRWIGQGVIAAPLFNLLVYRNNGTAQRDQYGYVRHAIMYDREDLALDALSCAAVTYGRQQAGLKPLETQP